jgi:hypothetical protein
LTEHWSQSPRAIGIHSGPPLLTGVVLGGRSLVGITSTGGSVQNEAHQSKTARPPARKGTARPGIRGPGSAPPLAQRTKSIPRVSPWCAWEGRPRPGTSRCLPEARPPHLQSWCAGSHQHSPIAAVPSRRQGALGKPAGTGPRKAGGKISQAREEQQRPPGQGPGPGASGAVERTGAHAQTGHTGHTGRARRRRGREGGTRGLSVGVGIDRRPVARL